AQLVKWVWRRRPAGSYAQKHHHESPDLSLHALWSGNWPAWFPPGRCGPSLFVSLGLFSRPNCGGSMVTVRYFAIGEYPPVHELKTTSGRHIRPTRRCGERQEQEPHPSRHAEGHPAGRPPHRSDPP